MEEVKTIVVSIGNTDNKLSQQQWAEFVGRVDACVRECAKAVHFMGGAANWMPWQNVAWMFDLDKETIPLIKIDLAVMGREYNQDSVAYMEGATEFL